MGYRFGKRYTDLAIHHIDMVILEIDMGYGLMIWEMTVSIWSSPISIWDIFTLVPAVLLAVLTAVLPDVHASDDVARLAIHTSLSMKALDSVS
jgi:hypothetical protein